MSLGRAGAIRRETVDLAGIEDGEAILDVGCGTGALTFAARDRAPSSVIRGIDASPEMIDVARRKSNRKKARIDFQVAAIEALPFPDGEFDIVLSSFMLHHLPADVKRAGLHEVRRVLKPGGRLAVVDFAGGAHGGFVGHLLSAARHGHHHEGAGLGEILREAGFSEVQTKTLKSRSLLFALGRKDAQ
jgi:demethylmenaquinone methyltransferase/2-methoxy-6-polyprenyl-1,4-benzoquinol methylase/phosphoethanolamine N-methyltransferase